MLGGRNRLRLVLFWLGLPVRLADGQDAKAAISGASKSVGCCFELRGMS
jgi:hypothetical protein